MILEILISSLLSFGISGFIAIILKTLGDLLLREEKLKEKKYSDPKLGIKYIWVFYIAMAILAYGTYQAKLNFYGSNGDEPDNLTSLIFEVFIGFAITYTVWLYSKRQHDESTSLLRRRENIAAGRIRSYLIGMRNHVVSVKEMVEEFNNLPPIPEGADTPPPKHTGRYIELLFALDNVEYSQKDFIEKLRTITNLSADVLILSDSENILEICDRLGQHRVREINGKKEYTDINVLCQKIDELLQSIPNPPV